MLGITKHTLRWLLRAYYGRAARSLIQGELASAFPLSGASLLADHEVRQVWRAESPGGPVIIKLYRPGECVKGRRYCELADLLRAAGIALPAIRHTMLPERPRRLSWSCHVSDFIAGRRIDASNPADVRLAFESLGLLHAITPAAAGEAFPLETMSARAVVKRNFARMRRSEFPEFRETREKLLTRLDPMMKCIAATPAGLLHGDYSRDNLVVAHDGTLHTLDFDDLQSGPVVLELAGALVHCFYGFRSQELSDVEIPDFLIDPRYEAAIDAWERHAGADARRAWEAHRTDLLLWAYVRALGNLAHRSRHRVRFKRDKRIEYHARAQTRAAKLRKFLESPNA